MCGYLTLSPLPPNHNYEFIIESELIVVGQVQKKLLAKDELLSILRDATNGKIEIASKPLKLISDRPFYFHSETNNRNEWFYQMHLQVGGEVRPLPSQIEWAAIDNQLRVSTPPFDGLLDAARWLDIGELGSRSTGMHIRVNPPVDLFLSPSQLDNDQLTLILHAHPEFDVRHIGLAVIASPGISIETRRQVASEITWVQKLEGYREGTVSVQLENADNALAILMINSCLVRRQWFVDAKKARNNRLLAVQHFDEDLKMVRKGVLESGDQNKFELGVASLLFLLGFTPSVQLETDAPDIVVTTLGGRLALVECTMRIADFATKIGKLVDRRGSLTKSLQASSHPSDVYAVLVCRLPRDQIAAQAEDLKSHNVILLAKEDLESAFERVRYDTNADGMLLAAEAELKSTKHEILGKYSLT